MVGDIFNLIYNHPDRSANNNPYNNSINLFSFNSLITSLLCHAIDGNQDPPKSSRHSSGENIMGREQKSNKENKKKSALTAKEKKNAKKAKKEDKGLFKH